MEMSKIRLRYIMMLSSPEEGSEGEGLITDYLDMGLTSLGRGITSLILGQTYKLGMRHTSLGMGLTSLGL